MAIAIQQIQPGPLPLVREWSASSTWLPSLIPCALRTHTSSRVAVAWRPCSSPFSTAIMPCIRWGHAWRARDVSPCSRTAWTRVLNDYRLGQILDALFGAQLNRVFGAIALNALDVYAIATPWLHQDTTTLTLYGAWRRPARSTGSVPAGRPIGPAKMAVISSRSS